MLEPPVCFGEVVERVDGEVVVIVCGGGGVAKGAVHAFCCPGCCVGGRACCEGSSGDEGGPEHFYEGRLEEANECAFERREEKGIDGLVLNERVRDQSRIKEWNVRLADGEELAKMDSYEMRKRSHQVGAWP